MPMITKESTINNAKDMSVPWRGFDVIKWSKFLEYNYKKLISFNFAFFTFCKFLQQLLSFKNSYMNTDAIMKIIIFCTS